jgi:addiction module RelB/DinJ family antitoxin
MSAGQRAQKTWNNWPDMAVHCHLQARIGQFQENSMRVSIDDRLTNEVAPIFEAMGMDLATGINIFLRKVQLTHSIPFTLEAPSELADGNRRAHAQARSALANLDDGLDAMRTRMNARKVGADLNQPEAGQA